ncbi:MAG: hypothetical protein HXS47_09905 [Theionarchaea archaeon]|nr:hypothetical protein [Theionarchaea archaeon]
MILTRIRELLDEMGSFVAGFGNRDDADINNAIFIAMELQGLDLPLDFKGAGRLGVESLRLYGILPNVKPNQKKQDIFSIGKMFSNFDSRELMLLASYLWNEGKSSLNEKEREEALVLLQKKFSTVEKEQFAKSEAATASG